MAPVFFGTDEPGNAILQLKDTPSPESPMHLESTRSLPRTTRGMPGARSLQRNDGASERTRQFDEAMRLLEDGCWHAAFLSLSELADDGHPQAARVALVFVKRGTSLFGGTFHASAEQRDSWEQALG